MSLEEALDKEDFAADVEAEVLERPKRRRLKRGRKDSLAADVVRAKAGVDLDAPGTTQVKLEEGKITEGKVLDKPDPVGTPPIIAPSDNSQTNNDNSQTHNNTTHNNYGGDGPMNTRNNDGSLFGATTYASADL